MGFPVQVEDRPKNLRRKNHQGGEKYNLKTEPDIVTREKKKETSMKKECGKGKESAGQEESRAEGRMGRSRDVGEKNDGEMGSMVERQEGKERGFSW